MDLPLTQLEFSEDDHVIAKRIARALGYTKTVYTSTSALIGHFCQAEKKGQRTGCVIRTRELGYMFVQDVEDLHLRGKLGVGGGL